MIPWKGILGRLAAAGLADLLLWRLLPLAPSDPFRGTLLLLPWLLLGAAEIARATVRQGGRRLSQGGTAGEFVALGSLVLLTLLRSHLGLRRGDAVLAAAFLLLLAHRVARQAVALRPLLGSALPDRPPALFFWLPLLAYLAVLPWSASHRQPDGDEPYNLLITHSLAYDFDADLTNNYAQGDWRFFMNRPIGPQPGDPVGPHGELYSRHNDLLPMALAPAYRVAGKAGALATMAALAAALAWLTLRLARHYSRERPGEALGMWALLAFAPPLLLYATEIWVEVPATLLTVLALDRILALPDRPGGGQAPWRVRDGLGILLPILLLPLVKIRFMLISGPLAVLGWWYGGRRKRAAILLGLLLVAIAGGILLYNTLLYSNPLKIHSWEEVEPYQHRPVNFALGLSGLLWDAAFGLFACAPLWLLTLPAAGLLLARRRWSLPVHLTLLFTSYLLVVLPRIEWYGGWSPPFRYGLVMLPLLAVALPPLLAQRDRPGARGLLAGLGALTLALALLWIVEPGWTYNFAHGRTYLLDHLSERLGEDIIRFFPSSLRPRTATWAWPLATLLLLPLLWWLPGRRRAGVAVSLLGIAGLLGLAAALPRVAARTPTTVVEFEDPTVAKSGGHLHPDLWVIERPRYRGGWVLRVEERLTTPVLPASGKRRVRLSLEAELIRNQPVPYTLDIRAGDLLLGQWTPRQSRTWQRITLGPFIWPAGQPLVLAAHGEHPKGELNGAILDRMELQWVP
ncbi:MAG TPA: hypothetical protein VMM92_06340 [Thermoanaerobaculia bacterium]|nr:hypothetical protein [Thermoanaerobaculia bacterium]